jgi:hypothetical protein
MGENMTSYIKMATVQEKTMRAIQFFETKSVIEARSRYRLYVKFTVERLGCGFLNYFFLILVL